MTEVWLVESQHLESGDTDVEVVSIDIDLGRYVEESFDEWLKYGVEVKELTTNADTVREWSVTAANNRDDYYVTATLHVVKVAP